ncbi:unnamed protein product, partial [Musa textilis]
KAQNQDSNSKKGALSAEKGGVFIDPKWIQNWAPNLKSNLEFPGSGGQRRCHHPRLGGSTAWPIQPKPNGPCLSPNLAQ